MILLCVIFGIALLCGGLVAFYFNLAGKWRSGMVHVVASRSGGKWNYSEINFIPTGGGGQIDLAYEVPPNNPLSYR